MNLAKKSDVAIKKKTGDQNKALREHLLYVLRGGGAHVDFNTFIADFPVELINEKPAQLPYTPWQVLEHMRLAQSDILEFTRNRDHVSPSFPEGYWPSSEQKADRKTWAKTIKLFRADLKAMTNLVEDSATDLFAEIPHGHGQTIMREALLIADHNAYHLGALFVMKRMLE